MRTLENIPDNILVAFPDAKKRSKPSKDKRIKLAVFKENDVEKNINLNGINNKRMFILFVNLLIINIKF